MMLARQLPSASQLLAIALTTAILSAAAIVRMSTADAASYNCAADLNQDGVVDVIDVLHLLNNWGSDPDLPADFNEDGIVDGWDLGYQLAHWGPCFEDLPHPVSGPLHVSIDDVTHPDAAAEGLRTYDIFLEFHDPDVLLLNVFNANIACDGKSPCFHHAVTPGGDDYDGAQVTPHTENLWNMAGFTYDSFVTIGLLFGDNNGTNADLNLSADEFFTGETLGENAGWFAVPPGSQGMAGTYPNNRVRIALLTVAENVQINGELSAMYRKPSGELIVGTSTLSTSDGAIGDLNNDGVVDGADLLILLAAWGSCPESDDCPTDLNHDGVVDGADLLILLANWG